MQGFKKCNNGHFYKEGMANCPYCPAGGGSAGSGGSSDSASTVVGGGGQNTVMDNQSTDVISGASTGPTEKFSGDRTMVFTPGAAASAPMGGIRNPGPSSGGGGDRNQFDRTFIGGMPAAAEGGDGNQASTAEPPRAARRIVGWIISYTIDPMGVDYRIFEGNNLIGRDPVNTIILSKESTISGRHATILYRSGKFWVKDEMSANGSFLNDAEMEIQKAYELKDNDLLRLGNTLFRFKSAE
jgi:hypothetical protein